MNSVPQFISEPIEVNESGFNPATMASGVPGLPGAFEWRNQTYTIVGVEEEWKKVNAEGYVRRHYFRVLTQDGSTFEIYCERKAQNRRGQKARWWIYRQL